MSTKYHAYTRGTVVSVLSFVFLVLSEVPSAAEPDLSGLWESRRILGPTHTGPMLIRKSDSGLLVEFAGSRVDVTSVESSVTFSLPSGGRFEGEMETGGDIRGHWIQPRSKFDGNAFATPVFLQRESDAWLGHVQPQPDVATFYLLLKEDKDILAAELINPERNLGVFQDLTRLEQDGDSLALYGRFRGRGEEGIVFRGYYYPDEEVIALRYPGRGGAYDFSRVSAEHATDFLARPSKSALIVSPPPNINDGWQTASMAEVGIDSTLIREMITTEILPAPSSSNDLSIHSILIARHGKLVVEEYFHGYHRNVPHDSRSASKSVTSILATAVMHAGVDLSWDTPVYSSMNKDDVLKSEPERVDITLRHLVNMNTGLDCDDRNPNSAAQEDVLWDNADDLDFYEHTLNVSFLHRPGDVSAYCSASANLAGGVIAAAADQTLLQLIDRLLAEPLNIERYSVPVPPDGHPFMGGGIRWLSRDFLKFSQLVLDGGRWNERQIMSKENAGRLITPEVKLDGGRDYGYLWWTIDYPFRDGTVRAHFMGGNGGQIAMLVPELNLSIVFNAGNYSHRAGFRIQNELIPKYILPSITD